MKTEIRIARSKPHPLFVISFSCLLVSAGCTLSGKNQSNLYSNPSASTSVMSNEDIQQFPANLSFYDTLMVNSNCTESVTLKAGETGSITCGEFVKAVKNFGAIYSSAGNLDYYPVKLPFDSTANADLIDIFRDMSSQTKFGLVFHYGYENQGGEGKLLYLLSKGTLKNDSVQYCPFSSGENNQSADHYIYLHPSSPSGFQVVDGSTFDSFKQNYTDSMMIKTTGSAQPVRQVVHPSMVYHNPESFWDFYRTYVDEANLHLYIAPGGIKPEGISTPMHSPLFVFGNKDIFYELNDQNRGRADYNQKALDIGQLCPPGCAEIVRCP